MTLSFIDHLETALRERPPKQKGLRTRERLKVATAKVLEERGYHAMRVSDICDAAGVGLATFYLYFENKSDITLQVLSEYLEQGMGQMAVRGAPTPFAAIRGANLRWLAGIRANAGLSRCITQLGDEEPGFRELAHRINRQWYERIAVSFVRRYPGAVSQDVALLAAYSLGAMMDEMARKLVVSPDPALLDLVGKIAPSDEEIVDFLTVLWYRALHGGSPDEAGLAGAAKALTGLHVNAG